MARKSDLRSYLPSSQQAKRGGGLLAAGALALAGAAFIVNRRSALAERSHPPLGSFVTSDGVRLHYVEHGNGPPVVFLHDPSRRPGSSSAGHQGFASGHCFAVSEKRARCLSAVTDCDGAIGCVNDVRMFPPVPTR